MKAITFATICVFALCFSLTSAASFTDSQAGRKLLQATQAPPPGYSSGYNATAIFNYTISAVNSTTSFQNHGNSIDTSRDQCLFGGTNPSNPLATVPGPLGFEVPVNYVFNNTLVKYYPNQRYQLYNVSSTEVTTVDLVDVNVPTGFRFAPTAIGQTSTILIGLFAGSDATARCLVQVTYTAVQPYYSPPPVASG